MLKIKAEKLTAESFAPFGAFCRMDKPGGHALTGELHNFYPDRLTAYQGKNVGYSPITVKKPNVMEIKELEYHTGTCEMIMPLSDDMIIHVAQPSAGKPITDKTRAFIVPKFTLVKINACVWHLAPLPLKEETLNAMIILPECTYINDCTVVKLSEKEKFIIEI